MQYQVEVYDKDTDEEKSYLFNLIKKEQKKPNNTIRVDKPYKCNKKNIDNDPNLCYQIALAEYEHSIRRLERLDNKIYILLTVCAFTIALLSSNISLISNLRLPQQISETILLIAYITFNIMAVIAVIFLLISLIKSLSSVHVKRFDSTEILERDMNHADKSQVSKYVVALYEKARSHNNELIDDRYKSVNRCVKALIFSIVLLLVTSLIGAILPQKDEKEQGFFNSLFDKNTVEESQNSDSESECPPYHYNNYECQ